MDEIMDFFDLTKDFVREEVPRGYISGNLKAFSKETDDSKPLKREFWGTEYADEFVREEKRKMDEFDKPKPCNISKMDTLDDDSEDEDYDYNGSQPEYRGDDEFYDKYPFDLNRDESLPIYDSREQIISLIAKNPVVVLEGDTGCGKTTQVPQYILDEAFKTRQYCKIVCTQPRRIAAITIASRVNQERKWHDGTVCGYQVGLHSSTSEDTRLLYCTTGVLLQRLVREKSLTQFTHIILDEVHERDQEMDFLLIVIRRLLSTNSRHVKIILMSATINTKQFAEYFTIRHRPAPVMRVDNRRNYIVRDFYTTDLGRISAEYIECNFSEPGISEDMYKAALKLLVVIERMEQHEASIQNLDSESNNASILVFLPGIYEIDTFGSKIASLLQSIASDVGNTKLKMFPVRLHSLISPDEQLRAFRPPPVGYRKVILATNIAESSITVQDVKYVIDFCLTRILVNDSASNFSMLQLQWASKANCRQRAGRAGRVQNGRVYRMVPKPFYEQLDEFGKPEMERCPLEKVLLKAKLLDMGSPPEILGLAMNPPNLSNIVNTILQLKEVGALYPTVDGVYTEYDGDLSFWGRVMDALPLDVRLSRLIIIGYMFSCFEEAVVIAAGLSVRALFLQNTNEKSQRNKYDAFIQKLVWADGSGSDLIAIWRAYNVFKSMCAHKHVQHTEGEWAKRYHMNLRSLREMDLVVQDLKSRLERLKIAHINTTNSAIWTEREKTIVLKIVFAGAFYPNYFLRDKKGINYERSIYQTLSGRDPRNTIFFCNFQARVFGELYTRRIKELFSEVRIPAKDIDVTFQPGTEKVFVTFKEDSDELFMGNNIMKVTVPGTINPNILKAVRMRTENLHRSLRIMDSRQAMRYVEEEKIGVIIDGVWQPSTKSTKKHAEIICLPSLFTKKMRGFISHIESCGKFYFQPLSEMVTLRQISEFLNEPDVLNETRIHAPSAITKGMVLSALRGDKFQRAIVQKIIVDGRRRPQFSVKFIDYGDVHILALENLRFLSNTTEAMKDYPPRMFECRLALVQPGALNSNNNVWNDKANDALRGIAVAGVIEIDIYSLVGNVASIIISLKGDNFNQRLVKAGLARNADENYLSKYDHDLRLRKNSSDSHSPREEQDAQNEEYLRNMQHPADYDLEPPPERRCIKSISLRGPYSPLETQMFSVLRVGRWKSVGIERDSVNAILLDNNPQDFHDQLIVAASVTENQCGDKITARGTSVMPNIHGFAALMALIFCPKMQLKCNATSTKYVSILAGLGYDPKTNRSLYEEHDLVLNLDVELSKDDITDVNKIRYFMDYMFHTTTNDDATTIPVSEHPVFIGNIKDALTCLLNKNRQFVEPHDILDDFKWNTNENLDNQTVDSIFGSRSLFRMHSTPRLCDETRSRLYVLKEHCKELHGYRNFYGTLQPTICKLCNQPLDNLSELRLHILSQMHRDREHQIGFQCEN